MIQLDESTIEQFNATSSWLKPTAQRIADQFAPLSRQMAEIGRTLEPLGRSIAENQLRFEPLARDLANAIAPVSEACARIEIAFPMIARNESSRACSLPASAGSIENTAGTLVRRRDVFVSSPSAVVERYRTIFEHDYDYRNVRLGPLTFQLGPKQGSVVCMLHGASKRPDPWVHGKHLLHGSIRSMRVSELFKSQPYWRALIESDGRGKYRLNLPR